LFTYYTSVLDWDRSYDISKINKQGCGLAEKEHGNAVIVTKLD